MRDFNRGFAVGALAMFAVACLITVAKAADAPPAPVQTFTGVLVFSVDGEPDVLAFITPTGGAALISVEDCQKDQQCLLEYLKQVTLGHVKKANVTTKRPDTTT